MTEITNDWIDLVCQQAECPVRSLSLAAGVGNCWKVYLRAFDRATQAEDTQLIQALRKLEDCFFNNDQVMKMVEKSQQERNPHQVDAQMDKLIESIGNWTGDRISILLVVPTSGAGELFKKKLRSVEKFKSTETTPDVTILTTTLTAKDLIAKELPQGTVDVILVLDSTYTGSLRNIIDAATELLNSASEISSIAVCACLGAEGHGHPKEAPTARLTPKKGPTKEAFDVIFYVLSLKQLKDQKNARLEANAKVPNIKSIAKIAYKIDIQMNGEGPAGKLVYSGEALLKRNKSNKTESNFSMKDIRQAHKFRESSGYTNIVYNGKRIPMSSAQKRTRSTKATLEGSPEFVHVLCMFIQNMSSAREGVAVANVRMIDAPGEKQSLSFQERKAGGSKKTVGREVPRFCVHLLFGKSEITKYCLEFYVKTTNQMLRRWNNMALTLGYAVKCEHTHKKHTDECTMERYARGIAKTFSRCQPTSFEKNQFKIACDDASKYEEVKNCVHALEDACDFAEKKNTIRST